MKALSDFYEFLELVLLAGAVPFYEPFLETGAVYLTDFWRFTEPWVAFALELFFFFNASLAFSSSSAILRSSLRLNTNFFQCLMM